MVTIPRLPSVAPTSCPAGTGGARQKRPSISLASGSTHIRLPFLACRRPRSLRLAAQTQVIRVVAMVGAKVEDQARRERQGERTVAALVRKLPPEVRFREKP